METAFSFYIYIALIWAIVAYSDGESIYKSIVEGLFFPYQIFKIFFFKKTDLIPQTSYTIHGVGVPHSIVKVYKDNVYFGSVVCDENGNYSFTPIGFGLYTFK
jgi:hypothetical protein